MKVYLDLVFFINFFFDTILLFVVDLVLKRNTKRKRILLGGLFGSTSTLFLFFSLNSLELFLFKVIISVGMVFISFRYQSLKDTVVNLLYLYFISILLGGFMYYLNLEFSFDVIHNVFVSNSFHLNIYFLLLLSPIILYFYYRQFIYQRKRASSIYTIELYQRRKKYQYTGYLDTGNRLYDPYTKKPVHLLYDPNYKISKKDKVIYVPYHGLQNSGIIPCVYFDKMIINHKKEIRKVLIGLSREPFLIDGVEMILQKDEIEEDS